MLDLGLLDLVLDQLGQQAAHATGATILMCPDHRA